MSATGRPVESCGGWGCNLELKYIASSGAAFGLKTSTLRAQSANFNSYSWEASTTAQQYGDRVNRFDKSALSYSCTLQAIGPLPVQRQTLNELHSAFEKDIFSMTPGRLYCGDFYIEAYIIASETQPAPPWGQNDLTIYAPYPFWVREDAFSFPPQENNGDASDFLDYPIGFLYDYTPDVDAFNRIENPGSGPANFQLTLWGPAVDPSITIDDRQIGVVGVVGARERVVIDSRNNSVEKIGQNGTVLNWFNNRLKNDTSIFAKISSGTHNVFWSGDFGFDLSVFEERSEPLWS